MNLTDLSEVLREHAEVPDTSHGKRLNGIQGKVMRKRRRQAVAGVACVVLALVGVIYAVIPQTGGSPEPAVPARSLPEYQAGTKLVAQSWVDLPTTSVTVRFVPKSLDLKLFTRCDIGKNRLLLAHITVNGRPYTQGSCVISSSPDDWASLGVVVGQPSEMTLVVDGEQDASRPDIDLPMLPPPASGTLAIGVGEGVPLDEYVFPARPQTLAAPYKEWPEPVVRSDPADPVRRTEVTLEWPGPSLMSVRTNTPGRLRVLVNDITVIDFSSWDYTPSRSLSSVPEYWESKYGLKLTEKESVRITVIPERTTGDWDVTLTPK